MQMIRAASDERTFYELKSLHFEKLKGDRSHQHSMRLNKQWRFIVEFEHAWLRSFALSKLRTITERSCHGR